MKKITVLGLIFLFYSVVLPVCAQEGITVKRFIDKESAGWAYKKNDVAFVAEKGGCRVQWNAIFDKDGSRWLEVRRECQKSFKNQIEIHRAILAEIEKVYSISTFKTIFWGAFCPHFDLSWCLPIAKASLESEDYTDYKKNYPNSKLKYLNDLFVQLANSTRAYKDFEDLLKEFRVTITLKNVEKVLAQKIKRLPFAKDFSPSIVEENPRVIFNAGMSTFSIKKKE